MNPENRPNLLRFRITKPGQHSTRPRNAVEEVVRLRNLLEKQGVRIERLDFSDEAQPLFPEAITTISFPARLKVKAVRNFIKRYGDGEITFLDKEKKEAPPVLESASKVTSWKRLLATKLGAEMGTMESLKSTEKFT